MKTYFNEPGQMWSSACLNGLLLYKIQHNNIECKLLLWHNLKESVSIYDKTTTLTFFTSDLILHVAFVLLLSANLPFIYHASQWSLI